MFKKMRLKDRELEIDDIVRILQKSDYGILSTISENGHPYGVPVNYIFLNDSIYFHCALEGHKLDNILINNKVSFCVVGQACILPDKFTSKYESVIIFGRATEVYGGEKYDVLFELIRKYSPDYLEQGIEYLNKASDATKVIKISIEHISGKAND